MQGLDMDAVKARLKSLKTSNKKSNLVWKPTDKEQTIRIVPYKYSPGNPFIELYFHYELNGKTYLSPISFGDPDPVMEVAQKLKSTGDKESWKQGKNLEPKLRTFAPIIVRGKEHEGVKFWGFGKTIYEDLLSNIADPECGDVTNPTTGRDITVWTVKEEGKNFATPKMKIKMTQTRIVEDKALLPKIADEQPDIKEIWELKSYEELREALNKHLNPEEADNSEAAPEAAAPKAEDKSEAKEKADTPTETNDIDAAFSALFK